MKRGGTGKKGFLSELPYLILITCRQHLVGIPKLCNRTKDIRSK